MMVQAQPKKQKTDEAKRMWSRWVGPLAAFGMLGALVAVSLSGCDTLANIDLERNTFSKIHVVGMTPLAGGACLGSSGDALLRLVPMSREGAIHEGMLVGSRSPVQFERSSIELSEHAVFSTPDEVCVEASDCNQQAHMVCGLGPGVNQDASSNTLKRCYLSEGVSVGGNPNFVSKVNVNQLFGVMMEHTNSFNGALPSSIASFYPDYTGPGNVPDGRGDSPLELFNYNQFRATDGSDARVASMQQMETAWKSVSAYAKRAFNKKTYFGLWTFQNSQASLISMLGDEQWTEEPSGVSSAIDKYRVVKGGSSTQSSVFESMVTLLNSNTAYSAAEFNGAEKVLVVFVDGPDELRLKTQTAQSVIDAALGAGGVRVFVVHLDAAVETAADNGTPYFVDDPEYVKDQDGYDDASSCDCKNFEECRKVTRYSSAEGAEATLLPAGEKNDKFFCVPSRDAQGRIGPVDDYAKIACATQGGYIYVSEAESIGPQMAWLPHVLDGLWEVPIKVDAFSRQRVNPGEAYHIQTTVSMSLDGSQKSYRLGQQGGDNGSMDSRAVLFSEF